MNALLMSLSVLAAIGLAASAVIHIMTWTGIEPPSVAMGLHIGIFVVWVPTVLVAQRLTREYKQKDFWKAALRGAPPWVKTALYAVGGYALLNFLLFMLLERADPDSELLQFRMFSGHWMVFYGAAAGVLYSASRVDQVDSSRACLNGHLVSATAHYCDQCGAPVAEPKGRSLVD